MKIKDLSLLMLEAINVGEANAIADRGGVTSLSGKANACHTSGLSKVSHWLTEHLISPLNAPQKSSLKKFDRTKPDSLMATCNRRTYLPMADKKL